MDGHTGLAKFPWVPRPVLDTEVVVSLPKFKTHHWAGVTCSLKNLFGSMPVVVYGWPKDVLHVRGIPESIVDLTAVRPDARDHRRQCRNMQGDGPIMGDPVSSGIVVVSR